jgi:hypothetical protein
MRLVWDGYVRRETIKEPLVFPQTPESGQLRKPIIEIDIEMTQNLQTQIRTDDVERLSFSDGAILDS